MEIQTKVPKELKIYQIANTALYKVAFTTGGELPEELSGKWTNPKLAQESIDTYLDSQAEKFAKIALKTK